MFVERKDLVRTECGPRQTLIVMFDLHEHGRSNIDNSLDRWSGADLVRTDGTEVSADLALSILRARCSIESIQSGVIEWPGAQQRFRKTILSYSTAFAGWARSLCLSAIR